MLPTIAFNFPGQEEVVTRVEGNFDRIDGNVAVDFEARLRAEFGGMDGPEVNANRMSSVGSRDKSCVFDRENKRPPTTKRSRTDK